MKSVAGVFAMVLGFSGLLAAGEIVEGAGDARPALWRDPKVAQQALMAEEAARMDAWAKIADRIFGCEIDGVTTVQDLVGADKTIESRMRAGLRGMKEGRWIYSEKGFCQVEVSVTWREVVELVEKMTRECLGGPAPVTIEELVSNNVVTRDKPIVVWGAGALPGTEGVEIIRALRAAELAACERIAAKLMGVTVDRNTRIRDLVFASEDLKATVAASLKGVEFTDYRTYADHVEVDAEVVERRLVERIKRSYRKSVKLDRCNCPVVSDEAFDEVVHELKDQTHKVTAKAARRQTDGALAANCGPFCGGDAYRVEKTIVERVLKSEILVD